jgi:hypothetical protein
MRLNFHTLARAVGLELATFVTATLCLWTALLRDVITPAMIAVIFASTVALAASITACWRDGRLLIWWRYPNLINAGVPLVPGMLHTDLFKQLEGALAAWTRLSPNMRGFLESAPDELVALAKQASGPFALEDAAVLERSLTQATEVRTHFEQLQQNAFAPRVQLETLRTRSHALAAAAMEQRRHDHGARS